jgi:hypothetical protein
VVLATMLALAGALIGFLLYIRPYRPPAFLSLPITEYRDRRYPPNDFAQQDGEALLQRFHAEGNRLAFNSQEGDLLQQEIRELSERKEKALVLHLSSLAICREGKVYLLPANADADRPETWLPLDTVLEALRSCPTPRKLLILDVMKPVADPRIGILHEEVADRVEQTIRGMQDCPFWVFCACSPGQVSLVSEDLHRSIFGYYLEQGLRGRADNAGPTGKTDGRITVRELASYVTGRVDRWANANRGMRQTPLLLGAGDDFELAIAEKTTEAPLEETPEDYPSMLKEGWTLRDGWSQDGGLRAAPGIFRNLDSTLLWAERRWRGGFGLNRVRENPATNWSRSQQQMDKARSGEKPRSRSLLLAVTAAKQAPDENTLFDLRHLAALAEKARKEKDPASAKQALDANVAPFLKKLEKQPLTVAEAAYLVALGDPQPDKVRFLAELVRTVQPKPQFAETAHLQQLAEIDPKKWPADSRSVHLLLQITRERERANSCDPEILPWVTSRLQTVSELQKKGATLLFQGDPSVLGQAEEKLQEAEHGLSACHLALDELQEARRLIEQGMEFLPADAAYLALQPGTDDGDENAWQEAVRACRELFEMLAPADLPINADVKRTADPLVLHQEALRRNTSILRDRLQRLGVPFTESNAISLQTLSDKPDASPATLLKMDALLTTPLLTCKQRTNVWKAARTLSRQLQARMETADADTEHPPLPVPAYDDNERSRLYSLERARGARRTRLLLGLMRLGGMDKPDLEEEAARLELNANDTAWDSLGNKLRDVWSREIPDRIQDLMNRKNLPKADALNRISPPFEAPPGARSRENQSDPAAELRRKQERKAWTWLGRQYQEEAESYRNAPATAAFYRQAADEFLQFAGRIAEGF